MRLVEGVAEIDDLDAFLSRLDEVAESFGVTIQAFDARYLVGREHLERAVELADRAIARDENVARDRGVEILLYAAGRRQIDDALGLGVGEGRVPTVILVAGGEEADENAAADALDVVDPAPTLGEYDPARVRDFFDVSDAEIAATDGDLPAIVRERVALLDVEK
ncbi:KEOPS complex subunit Cgi121 [Haloplanus sp. GCM10025708]|uniref:KEOPS complex subunit Cgi121 n=1 Tax=Haloferacaceae TaxID=1644056 RepID=UPI00361D5101